MRKLIIGCGYLGKRVASAWLSRGDQVTALTRSEKNANQLRSMGIEALIGDVTQPDSLSRLPQSDTLLYAVGFDRNSGQSLREIYVEGLENVLRELSSRIHQLIYISSSSVYGQSLGEWVDEESPCNPTTPNGAICLDAEKLVKQYLADDKTSANILRLAGIYGPGRLLRRLEQIKSNEPIAGNPNAWLNLIHVDDAVQAVLACEQRGIPGETYLVCQNQPVTRREYYEFLSKLADAPVPDFTESDSHQLNKRCSNRKLSENLEVELTFPTVSEGLQNALNISEE